MLIKTLGVYYRRFYTRRFRPEVQPLTLSIPLFFLLKSYSFCIPFIEKSAPSTYLYKEQCIVFLKPWNEINEHYYWRTSCITRRDAKRQVLFVQFTLWRKQRYSDFPTLSKTSICEIATFLIYTCSLRKVRFSGGASS